MLVDFESDETSVTILRGRTQPARKYLDSQADLPIEAAPSMAGEPVLPSFPAPRRVQGHLSSPAPIPAPPTLTAAPAASSVEVLPAAGPAAGDAVSAEALWRGFQEGAGVTLPLPNGPSPELFSAIGAMMKIAVEGIHRLVAMRTLVKSGMQADLTMIQARGNNPLKFSPDPSVALERLLQPPERGYLAGPSALRDALIDLQSHQIGVMTGMSAALAAVLDRFDPVHLETRLSARSVFDSLVPAHRRSRLWELYLEHFRSLKVEAQEDFNRLFNDAFREAYEEQVRILEQSVAQDAQGRGKPR
jgi:FHA domain-containing protein